MERSEFKIGLINASPVLKVDDVNKWELILTPPYDDGNIGTVIAIEELAELQQELSKNIRGKGDQYDLLQEVADVWLILEYIKRKFKITEDQLNRAINVKVERNLKRAAKEGCVK